MICPSVVMAPGAESFVAKPQPTLPVSATITRSAEGDRAAGSDGSHPVGVSRSIAASFFEMRPHVVRWNQRRAASRVAALPCPAGRGLQTGGCPIRRRVSDLVESRLDKPEAAARAGGDRGRASLRSRQGKPGEGGGRVRYVAAALRPEPNITGRTTRSRLGKWRPESNCCPAGAWTRAPKA